MDYVITGTFTLDVSIGTPLLLEDGSRLLLEDGTSLFQED